MKKNAFLVASAVVCASAAAFADNVQGDNVFGVLPVLSKAADTIVAVPWCACSTNNDEAIAISNIVKTANLTERDMVYVLDGPSSSTAYKAWELQASGGVLYWVSVENAGSGGSGSSPAADAATAARGTAIRLHRQSPTDGEGNAKPFYLFGQVGTLSTITTAIAPGTSEAPAYTLIAPPGASDVDLLEDDQLTKCQAGDEIVVRGANGVNTGYFYDGGWKYVTREFDHGQETVKTNGATSITLPAGFGAWYISRGTAPTLEWKNVTKKTN